MTPSDKHIIRNSWFRFSNLPLGDPPETLYLTSEQDGNIVSLKAEYGERETHPKLDAIIFL